MHQPHSNAMPVTAESTAPLRPSRSAGASLDTAHSCQVEESALGSAVELSRSSACLSLRTAARTQRRLFFDSANLDNDDGVALNKVSRGSLEYMRASKGSLEYRLVSSRSLNSRQISKGGTAVVSPAVVPTAALLGAALAGQQSMQQPLPAVLHRTMAPIAAVLIAMLLAIVAVCAAHYLRVRRGTHATVHLLRRAKPLSASLHWQRMCCCICKAPQRGSSCDCMAQTHLRPTWCSQHMTLPLSPLLLPAAGLIHSVTGRELEPQAGDTRQRIFGIL